MIVALDSPVNICYSIMFWSTFLSSTDEASNFVTVHYRHFPLGTLWYSYISTPPFPSTIQSLSLYRNSCKILFDKERKWLWWTLSDFTHMQKSIISTTRWHDHLILRYQLKVWFQLNVFPRFRLKVYSNKPSTSIFFLKFATFCVRSRLFVYITVILTGGKLLVRLRYVDYLI